MVYRGEKMMRLANTDIHIHVQTSKIKSTAKVCETPPCQTKKRKLYFSPSVKYSSLPLQTQSDSRSPFTQATLLKYLIKDNGWRADRFILAVRKKTKVRMKITCTLVEKTTQNKTRLLYDSEVNVVHLQR